MDPRVTDPTSIRRILTFLGRAGRTKMRLLTEQVPCLAEEKRPMSPEVKYTLVAAAFLATLLAGLLLAFAVLVMPGIGKLRDRDFLVAFREIDGVIQRGNPIFGLIWVGSTLALVVGTGLAAVQDAELNLALLVVIASIHVVVVQLPTARINIPLNNQVQALDLESLDEQACGLARDRFENRWNRWNRVRTVAATGTAALLWGLVL